SSCPELDLTIQKIGDFMLSICEILNSAIEYVANLMASELRDAGFTTPLDAKSKTAARGTVGVMQTFDRLVAKIWSGANK
ncbi:UNVERIFIED_CONTAM: hypothetical protein HDU68_008020, partial [Siphonaria sp. JEL0065]